MTYKREGLPARKKSESVRGEFVYELECGIEVTASQVIEMTGWSSNTVYGRLRTTRSWEELTKPLKITRTKHYVLSDGTTMTAPELSKIVGCTNSTACLRLQKSDDRAFLTRKLEGRGSQSEWVDEPVKIVMGIPINPSYMDGSPFGAKSKDRYGKVMASKDATSLMRYRKAQREEWLHSKGVKTDDEVDESKKEW